MENINKQYKIENINKLYKMVKIVKKIDYDILKDIIQLGGGRIEDFIQSRNYEKSTKNIIELIKMVKLKKNQNNPKYKPILDRFNNYTK